MVPNVTKCDRSKLVVSVMSLLAMVMRRRVVNSFCVSQKRLSNVQAHYKQVDVALRWSEAKLANDESICQSEILNENSEMIRPWTDHHVDTLLVHWRGEDVEGYSLQFRHIEFKSALSAVLNRDSDITADIHFENALNYTGTKLRSPLKIKGYNQAMQYLFVPETITLSSCLEAAKRCSLIHALYLIAAETDTRNASTDSYDRLANIAVENDAFADMQVGQVNANQTWSLRVRHYGSSNSNDNDDDQDSMSNNKDRRYGERTRSISLEKRALKALTPVLCALEGKVKLHNPDCRIYVFDGLLPRSNGHRTTDLSEQPLATRLILARRITSGARRKVSAIHPTSRICVTNTPLCPLASFIMANIARIRTTNDGFAVLDPYCGSGGTLLAAAMVLQMSKDERQSTAQYPLVGIEVCHDGIVNREDIRRDFTTRNWTNPITLLHGDSTQPHVRRKARDAIGCRPFDAIITDPPYGIRESNKGGNQPVQDLLRMIIDDRNAGSPLLRIGGRLVVFIPHRVNEETTDEIFPTNEQLSAAGLICEYCKEQPLNEMLSRWLISYVCMR
jgi:Putative RNA methylase family UPF0020